jgi:hypothetical protein
MVMFGHNLIQFKRVRWLTLIGLIHWTNKAKYPYLSLLVSDLPFSANKSGFSYYKQSHVSPLQVNSIRLARQKMI